MVEIKILKTDVVFHYSLVRIQEYMHVAWFSGREQ